MATRARMLILLVAAALAVVVAVRFAGRPAPRLSVLLITIDTLRADALAEADMPALSGLARRGLRFVHARTPVPLTLPAHLSILSGLEPPGHGVRDNTAPRLAGPGERGFPLLAEEFSDAGYATAAFVASSVLDPRYGLDAGFSEYRHAPPPRPGEPAYAALPAEEQVRRFRAWTDSRPKRRPFFAWVHLWEPHAPYAVFDGDERRAPTAESDPPAERYRGEVRRADAAVEALLAGLDLATTVVVVTSDHGEALGEHGEPTHGLLCFGATLDVPLVLAGPGIAAGREDDRPCSLADLAPTLRALCGLDAQRSDGSSLLAAPRPGRIVCGESLYAYRLYRWSQQSAATDGRHSLVDTGHRVAIFDLEADPGETDPAPDPVRHAKYARLDRALAAYRRRRAGEKAGELISTAAAYYGALRIRESEFLARPAENRALRDVEAGWDDLALLQRAERAVAARDRAACRRLLDPLAALANRDRRNAAASLTRGRALLKGLDRPAEAAADLREAIRRGYTGTGIYRLLEEACAKAGDAEGLAWVRQRLHELKKAPR